MEDNSIDKQKCVTFTWTIENASSCFQKPGEEIKSPTFSINFYDYSKWHLSFYPRGRENENYIGFSLYREEDLGRYYPIDTDFEISLLAADFSSLKLSKGKQSFYVNEGFVFSNFERRKTIFVDEKSNFLPKDTLTVRCRIWCVKGDIQDNVEYVARTRIGVEWRSFVWTIPGFSSLQNHEKRSFCIKTDTANKEMISVNAFLTQKLNCEEFIRFECTCRDSSAKVTDIQLILLDATGKAIECIRDEFWFDDSCECKPFPFAVQKSKLLADQNLYLPGDVLTIQCECTITTGIVMEKIEKFSFGKSDDAQATPTGDFGADHEERLSRSTRVLKEDFKFLYSDGFLSDVILKTETAAFPAHKIILASRSSVFKAMFSSDMREAHGDTVDIEDISDDTLKRMLEYLYTAHVEGLQWESAIDLYIAANKYEILSLKDNCSSFLRFNLTPTKACEILLLSDLCRDDDLKTQVQNYILKYDKDIFYSDDWNHIIESDPKLAAYTMSLKYK
ncbi:BTB and MATH domain-containing protein 42 [Caerostris extrusa]|uniref:BTB and MATH domain-containing protein 42 n=1 Tax=Caerostris extrusa TaxID=172846 RepID=A0AAV4MCS1_CAEEX|nr:BTB and MATH domain-containing protein 42 [Caerostris extrusa]